MKLEHGLTSVNTMKTSPDSKITFDINRSDNIWYNFYKNLVAKHNGFANFIKIDRDTRIEIINEELKQYHSHLEYDNNYTGVLVFESEEHKTWFILRYS